MRKHHHMVAARATKRYQAARIKYEISENQIANEQNDKIIKLSNAMKVYNSSIGDRDAITQNNCGIEVGAMGK